MSHERGKGCGPRGRRRGRSTANRGDIRAAILALLNEEPMHGYQIIQELTERTNGAWAPSPGSVYPTLQQLADEGLVTSDDEAGRKTFALTSEGSTAAAAAEGAPPWEELAEMSGAINLRHSVRSLGGAARQVAMTGSADQVASAEEILNDARKRLYQLLAE